MTVDLSKHFASVFQQLERFGLLLVSDQNFPSVAKTIARKQHKGSWWSHPEAHTIFAVNNMLEDHPDVLIMKLISGKVTFVHRELWGLIYSIAVAREHWQMKPLSSAARALLKRVDAEQSMETGVLGKKFDPKPNDAARELEFHLLIHTKQVHTKTGAHAKILETWDHWAKTAKFRRRPKDPVTARRSLENRLHSINPEYPNRFVRFPWPPNV
jgi:hypothetical protein